MNFKFLSFLVVLSTVNCYDLYYDDKPYLELLKTDENIRNYYHPFFNTSMAYLKHISVNTEINSNCRSSLKRWITGIELHEEWALKILESTGKTINSRLNGEIINFGSFDFCSNFRGDSKKNIDFDGKYCLVSVLNQETEIIKNTKEYKKYVARLSKRSQDLTLFNIGNAKGVCMPSTCSIHEILSVTNKMIKPYGFSILPPNRCVTPSEPEPITNIQIVSFLILLTFLLLGISSLFTKNKFISNFSIADGYNYLYASNPNDNSKVFMHFVKFLMIFSSISIHVISYLAFYFSQPVGTLKVIQFNELLEHFIKRVYIFGTGMYFLGGFFVVFSLYDIIKHNKIKYNFYNFFISKYMKIFIISIAYILVTFIAPQFYGSGPKYSDVTNHMSDNCKENYWRIFLLISNEAPFVDHCSISTWYQSAEFQAYIINFFVIYYLVKRPKLGFALGIVQMILVSAFALYYNHVYKVRTIMNMMNFYVYDFTDFEDLYLHFFQHYNTYTIGMFTAALIKSRVKFRILKYKTLNILISIFMFSSMYAFVNYLDYLEKTKESDHPYIRFFMPIIDKLLISIPSIWFFFLALGERDSTENTNKLKSNDLNKPNIDKSALLQSSKPSALSILKEQFARIFISWSKLSFSLAAFQFLYVGYSVANLRTPASLTMMSLLKELVASYIIIFVFANIIFIFIENPLHKLNKNYLGLKRETIKRNDNEINNNLVTKKSN